MSKKKKVVLWVAGAFVALIVLAAIFGETPEEEAAGDETRTEQTTAPAKPAAKPEDTGRMSQGEFDRYMMWVRDVRKEQGQLADASPKCGVLIQAMELAEASECLDDAFDGLDVSMQVLSDTLAGLEDDVAKKCLVAVRQMKQATDGYANATTAAQQAGKNLQFDEFIAIADDAANQSTRFDARHNAMLAECQPEDWKP